MYCKYCKAEMKKNSSVCPECGKDNNNNAQLSTVKIIGATVVVVLLIVALVAVIVGSVKGDYQAVKPEPGPSTSTTTTTTTGSPSDPATPVEGVEGTVTQKSSYTVSDDVVTANGSTVVATLGESQLTVAELQIYYWMQVINFLDEYGSYAIYYGLDYTQPLDAQMATQELTWQQYFLQCALDDWKFLQALKNAGVEAGYELDAEGVQSLEDLATNLQTLATNNKFDSVDALLQNDFGPGATMDAYRSYMSLNYWGYGYYDHLAETMVLTDQELEDYFSKNAETLAQYSVTKESGNMADVRHILVKVAGSTTEDWAACEAAAQAILDGWKAGEATEESFAALAKEKSEDGGSASNGGLYTNIFTTTNFVPTFKNWCLDPARQPGDTELVKSDYGYHIMYFVAGEPAWERYCRTGLSSEKIQAMLDLWLEADGFEVDYGAISLGLVNLA